MIYISYCNKSTGDDFSDFTNLLLYVTAQANFVPFLVRRGLILIMKDIYDFITI